MDIKRVIKEKGFEVKQVAEIMGITPTGLSQHINGNPSVKTLERIAEVIGCSPADFFADTHSTILCCPKCGAKFQMID